MIVKTLPKLTYIFLEIYIYIFRKYMYSITKIQFTKNLVKLVPIIYTIIEGSITYDFFFFQ